MANQSERSFRGARRAAAAYASVWLAPALAVFSCLQPELGCEDAAAVCTFISECGPGSGHLSPGQCPGTVGNVCCVPEEACPEETVECCFGAWASRPECVQGAFRCPLGATLGPLGSCLGEAGCEASGGRVATGLCCASSGDFPNTCAIGACGCSPDNSHEVAICECPDGECFDGSRCVDR